MSLSIGELVGYVGLDTSKAESAADRIGSMFDKLGGSWGKTLAGTGAVAGGLFAAGLVGAINVEPSRDRVAAALQLTEAEAERAGRVSAGLYSDAWGESAEDVDVALEAVMSSIGGMRTASEADLRATTESALTLSTAMGVDVTRAAQVAGNMIANGMAKDGVQAMDLLARAMSKVPVQLREDVMDATDEYGQFFSQLGIKGPQAMGMLAAGAKKGMYGIDKAGDAVKEFTIRSTDMSATSKAAYSAIGLDAGKMAGQLLAGGDKAHKATDRIVDGLLGIKNPVKRANASIALFGTPLEDLGVKGIPTFLRSLKGGGKQLGKFEGSTKRMGATLNDNAKTNLTEFSRTVKTKFVDLIGGKVLPTLTDWSGELNDNLGPALDAVGDAVSAVTGFLADHKSTAKGLAGVIVGLTAITAAHAAVLAVSAAGGMAAWLKGTKAVTMATKVAAAVQWALNAAMSANPIMLAVIAIAALVAVFVIAYKKSETFRKIVTKAMDGVKHAAVAVGHFFTKKLPAFFSKAWDKAKEWTTKGVDKIVGWVKALPGRIVRGLSSLRSKIGDLFSRAMEHAKDKVTGIGGTIVGWIKAIPGKLGNLGGRFASAGRALLQGFINGMKNAAGIIGGIAGKVWDTVRGMLNGAIDRINAALEFTINTPGPGGITINPPNIPALATGGRVTTETIARIGEKEPETVLRDRDIVALLTKARDAGRSDMNGGTGRGAPLIGQVVQAPGESADVLAERLWFKTRTRG